MRGLNRKHQILNCAQAVISTRGFHKAQIEDISLLAHISKPTIYHYFRSKEHLILSLLNRYLNNLKDEIDDLSIRYRDYFSLDDLKHHLRQRIALIIDFICRDPDRGSIITKAGGGLSKPYSPILERIENVMASSLRGDLAIAREKGILQKDINIEYLTQIMLGAIFQICYTFGIRMARSEDGYNALSMADEIIKLL